MSDVIEVEYILEVFFVILKTFKKPVLKFFCMDV